jgi:hypothetical protein
MPTKGTTGKGTVLSIVTTGTTPTTTPILNMRTYSFSGQSVKFDDITNLSSSTQGTVIVEESLPATMDPGTLTASGIWIPSDPGYEAIVAGFTANTLLNFTLQMPIAGTQTTTGNLYSFTGYIQDNPLPDADYSKAITIKITIKLNSAIVPTAGS